MLRWLRDAGAEVSRVSLRARGNGEWYVVARTPIASGERVLAIPLHCVATDEHKPLVQFVLDECVDPNSQWRSYLDALPRRFPHHPSSFTNSEMALLDGSFVAMEARAARATWASLAVMSRSFAIGNRRALIPLVDMIDHRDPPETDWDVEGEMLVLTALRSYAAGEEIHDNYGEKSNSRLLSSYGFCDASNPHDEARIMIDGASLPVVPRLDDGDMRKLLAFLRHRSLDSSCDHNRMLAPVSLENETSAVRALESAARAARNGFATAIADDERLLQRRLSINARNAILARMSEKRALEWILNFAATVLPRLQVDHDTFIDAVTNSNWPSIPFDAYLRSVALGISRAAIAPPR
jgi:histone-lysine N-methyltransferase SETD3